jgi:hypothetical protein
MRGIKDPAVWALAYAGQGFKVLPLRSVTEDDQCDCGSNDCAADETKRGKHPRTANGYKDATTDLEQLREWWRIWPNANVGVATVDGLVVIDIDPRHGGDSTWERLTEDRELPVGPVVRTGSGGYHYWFRGRVPRHGADALGRGVDVKAEVDGRAGYVVVPPSSSAMGPYEWETVGVPLPPLPDWLAPEDRPTPQLRMGEDSDVSVNYALAALRGEAERAAARRDGERRRDGLFVASLKMSHYCPPLDLEQVATVLAKAGVESGLDFHAAASHVRNGLRTGLGGVA